MHALRGKVCLCMRAKTYSYTNIFHGGVLVADNNKGVLIQYYFHHVRPPEKKYPWLPREIRKLLSLKETGWGPPPAVCIKTHRPELRCHRSCFYFLISLNQKSVIMFGKVQNVFLLNQKMRQIGCGQPVGHVKHRSRLYIKPWCGMFKVRLFRDELDTGVFFGRRPLSSLEKPCQKSLLACEFLRRDAQEITS